MWGRGGVEALRSLKAPTLNPQGFRVQGLEFRFGP